jgi:pimeloyl-ACP methyl ester carboxylesterase
MTSNATPAYPLSPVTLAGAGHPVPRLAAMTGTFVGGRTIVRPDGRTIRAGQMYVACLVPEDLRSPTPVVMIHGGGGQGTDFLSTPDGRPGWAFRFLQAGHAIYVVDRPGHGRSPFHPDALGAMSPLPVYEDMARRFTASHRHEDWPQAPLHRQWPDGGEPGSPTLDQLMSSVGPTNATLAEAQALAREAGAALLDQLGPSILLTHSMGGPCGWAIADARPDLVKAIVAVEPLSPPFMDHPLGRLDWGLTAIPLTFDPPVADPGDLHGGGVRRLASLAAIPVAVLTAEASWMVEPNRLVVDFLRSHGVTVDHLRLEEHGIRGNGHMMVSEANSDEIADLVLEWIHSRPA